MFLIQTREEFLTIEMQSSPEIEHNGVNYFSSGILLDHKSLFWNIESVMKVITALTLDFCSIF